MGYEGPRLHRLINREAAPIAARMIVGDAMERWHTITVANTPIETGNLRTAWYRWPPAGANRSRRQGLPAWVAYLRNPVDYAPHVEWDTRPHVIRPVRAKALRFVARDGTVVFAQKVNHPGTKGAHMLSIGAHMTEMQFDSVAEEGLRLFERLLEEGLAGG